MGQLATRIDRPAVGFLLLVAILPTVTDGAGRPGDVRNIKLAQEMVRIPAGRSVMGFPDSLFAVRQAQAECEREIGPINSMLLCQEKPRFSDASPERTVFLTEFEIDTYEVTSAQYRRCVDAKVCDPSPFLLGDPRYIRDSWPLVNVTWSEALSYCHWLGKRLPSEAEWEKAARAGQNIAWPWGNSARMTDFNHGTIESEAISLNRRRTLSLEIVADDSDGFAGLAPPGSYPFGRTAQGVYDLAGNVAEWTMDYYSEQGYRDLPTDNPIRLTRANNVSLRTTRGGSWLGLPSQAHTYARASEEPTARNSTLGFRCVRPH